MTSKKLVRQPAGPVDKRKRPRGLTQGIRIAIDAIVYDRCTRAVACEKAGITQRALYLALEKSEVAAHWNSCIKVLRTGERARNLHRLTELRDQDENRGAAVKSVQLLEQLDVNDVRPGPASMQPGMVIVIHAAPPTPSPSDPSSTLKVIEVTPASGPTLRCTDED